MSGKRAEQGLLVSGPGSSAGFPLILPTGPGGLLGDMVSEETAKPEGWLIENAPIKLMTETLHQEQVILSYAS